ncbi:MAG: hypothetical protein NTZ05_02220 [Chloroflexi bacterium]|nr:hypothetical protein [Chloroflexota bacterium]
MSADEQLLDRLLGLEGDAPPRDDVTVLVAINDGRLVDVLDRQRGTFGWLAREAERSRTPGAVLEPGGVWVIDLKRRSYVRLRPDADTPSVMRRVLARLTAAKEWEDCGGCVAQDACPILRNARRLGDAGDGAPAERLERLLLLAHLRGQRHTTMRDLRSALAYLITADLGCREVHVLRRRGDIPVEAHYWEGAFTTPAGGDRSDILLGELQLVDPARFAQPHLERYLYFNQYPEDAPLRAALFGDGWDFPAPPLPGDSDAAPAPEGATPRSWLARMKRRLFFEARPVAELPPGVLKRDWPGLLPYRYADVFIAALSGAGELSDVLPIVARGIGRSDGLAGRILEGNLSLKVAHSDKERLTVCKQFPLSEFMLEVERPPAGDVIEATPQSLTLRHQSGVRLDIPLDLFELLCRMADGLEAGSPEFVPLLEDLAPFKNAVHRTNAIDLILIESGRRYHKLTQRDGKVVRLDVEWGE